MDELVFDCTAMTGYDREARKAFVDWHRAMAKHISRIAIVTVNPLWDLVIAAMALASATRMQSFRNRSAALNWLGEVSPD